MSDIVERVAKAMFAQDQETLGVPLLTHNQYAEYARAAITAALCSKRTKAGT